MRALKRYIYPAIVLTAIVLLASCTRPAAKESGYAYGADLSWLTEQERDGVIFRDPDGNADECMHLLQGIGMNSVRLRVWVNHETGWCNLPDMLVKARRADSLGLRLMIDFHYSDFFADPHRQDVPAEWLTWDNPDGNERTYADTISHLTECVYAHTKIVLQALKAEGITPEWVQVGNETRYGTLWPYGRTTDEQYVPVRNGEGWSNYAKFVTAGYEACHEVFPDVIVINHIDNAYMDNVWFYKQLQADGGKWDMIGLSHYPMMGAWSGGIPWQEMNERARRNIIALHEVFGCPVMLSEIGTMEHDPQTSQQVIADVRSKLDTLPYFGGIFYWEPQVFAGWRPQEYIPLGWGAYDMGAFKTATGQPNEALVTLFEH